MTPDPPTRDAWDEAAALITEVGRLSEDARRYRALGTLVAEPTFDRVLAIGSEVRQAARAGRNAPIVTAVLELRALLARCANALTELRADETYREMLASYAAGDAARTVEIAAKVYTDVTTAIASRPLHWPVPLRGRGAVEHFVPAERCAGTILDLAATGIPAPGEVPDLGGDGAVRPIRFSESPDPAESPITLVVAPDVLPGPVGRLAGSDVVLWYAERLKIPFGVAATASVGDEWWQVRPDAYRTYLEDLRRALAGSGWNLDVLASDD